MPKSNRDILCGHLIVDFANSKTSDEAGLSFIANVQKVFGFHPQFTTEAQNNFTQLKTFFSELSPIEKELFQLFIAEIDLYSLIRESTISVYFEGYNHDLEDYDYGEGRTLLFEIYPDPFDDEKSIYRTIKIGKSDKRIHEKLKDMFYKYADPRCPEDLKDDLFAELSRLIPEYVRTGDKILEILHAKKLVPKKRYKQIEKMAYHYSNYLQNEHNHIDEIRSDLHICLESISHHLSSNHGVLDRFLSVYNNIKISIAYVTCEGNIAKEPSFKKDIFLSHDYKNSYYFFKSRDHFDACTCIYHQIIAYCLFHHLVNSENKKRLKRCQHCNDFYIATKLNRRQKYCSDCSSKSKMTPEKRRAYMKRYRNNLKREKAETKKMQFEEKINQYMKNLNITRQEALEMYEDDEAL